MTTKYQNLLNRRTIPQRFNALNESYASLQENEDIRYLLGAMEQLDPTYTKNSLEDAERVQNYIESFCTVRLQGSVTTNTHIRYYSDVDLLGITTELETWEGPRPAISSTFYGDPVTTLRNLRTRQKNAIRAGFPQVTITEKDRAFTLSGGSLNRTVDVVTANWYNTLAYVSSYREKDRGVQVLSTEGNSRVLNKPFLHQHLLNEKNAATGGGMGRAIRLLKTLKVDASSKIEISSYDICSLVWNMDSSSLPGHERDSLRLANNCASFLLQIVNDVPRLHALRVPNQMRTIIGTEGTTIDAVRSLWYELHMLLEEIKKAGKALERPHVIYNRSLVPVS